MAAVKTPPPLWDLPSIRWMLRQPWVVWVRSLLQRIKPWGAGSVNLEQVLQFLAEGLFHGGVTTRAAAISFRLFLAFFPAMILLLSIIPFTPLNTGDVLQNLLLVFPAGTVEMMETTVKDLMEQRQASIISVGFLLLIFYASGSVNAILLGFGESYLVDDPPNWWAFRLLSLLLLLVLALLLGAAVLMVGFAGDVLVWMEARGWINSEEVPWLSLARWVLAVGLIFASVTILYHAGNWKKWKMGLFSVGATVATLLIVLLSLGFSYFIGQFATYNKLYGSLGTLLVTLIWLNANSVVLLLGFELDAAIHRARLLGLEGQQALTLALREDGVEGGG
ncbi:MAG: hypothetical protein RJA19_234 [Bacteroidota bacterium]|jgi:membrane protein